MKRINVTLYDEVFEEIDGRTKERKCGSIAQSIRELIDLGIKIEKAAKQNNEQNEAPNELQFISETLKNMMRWTLESLLISRQLLMKFHDDNPDEAELLIKKCKEQAINHSKKMFEEVDEILN